MEKRIMKRKMKLARMLNTGKKMRLEALRKKMMRRARKKLEKTRVTIGEEIKPRRTLMKKITKKLKMKPLKARMKLLKVRMRMQRRTTKPKMKMNDSKSRIRFGDKLKS